MPSNRLPERQSCMVTETLARVISKITRLQPALGQRARNWRQDFTHLSSESAGGKRSGGTNGDYCTQNHPSVSQRSSTRGGLVNFPAAAEGFVQSYQI